MSMQDPIADFLTRIRNAILVSMESVSMPHSTLKESLCKVLEGEGYIRGFSVAGEVKRQLTIELKYFDGVPVIEELHRISRPGLRTYTAHADLPSVRGGLGIAIVSTNRGLMTDHEARQAGLGGEILCTVF